MANQKRGLMKKQFILVGLLLFSFSVFAQVDDEVRTEIFKKTQEYNRFENAFLILDGNESLLQYRLTLFQIAQLNSTQFEDLLSIIENRYTDRTTEYNLDLINSYIQNIGNIDTSISTSDLVGIWHIMPIVAAGYSQRFFFNSDNSFIWYPSQMDEASRLGTVEGTWSVENGFLKIQIISYRWRNGGDLSFPYSTEDYYILRNGTVEIVDLSVNPIIVSIPISNYLVDPETINEYEPEGMYKMKIGGWDYWKGNWN